MCLWVLLKYSYYLSCCFCVWGWWAVTTLPSLSVWLVTLVLRVYLHLCSLYSAWVLAGLAKRSSSSHSYHPPVTYCVVCPVFPHFILCHLYLVCCETCILLWAYIIEVFSRSFATVSSFTFSCCLLNDHIAKWPLSALQNHSLPICRIQCSCTTKLKSHLCRANQVYESGMWILLYLYSCY